MAEGTRLLSEYGVTSLIEGSNPSLSVLQIACTRGNSRDVGSRPVSTDKAAQPANGSVMAAVGDQRLGGAEMRELPRPSLCATSTAISRSLCAWRVLAG